MRQFAADEHGLWYFELLKDFGKTPTEWGELDPHERLFLETASQEYNERMSEEYT